MRKFPLLCATALTAVSLTAGGVMAETKMEAPDATMAEAGVKANAEKEAAVTLRNVVQKRAFLDTLYKAQVALHSKDRDGARKHILDADKQLDAFSGGKRKSQKQLPENDQANVEGKVTEAPAEPDEVETGTNDPVAQTAPETPPAAVEQQDDAAPANNVTPGIANAENIYQDVYAERKVLEVEFGSTLMPEKAVMPVKDGQVTVAAIEKALRIEGLKKGELKDVDVRYIADDMDVARVREQLNQAKDELVKNEYYGAQYDLLQIQRGMLEDAEDVVPAQTRARDNLALTRYLVREEEFEAARETVTAAQTALDELDSSETNIADLSQIKDEVKTLRAQIEKRDPTMLEKIDKKLESWWKKLS